MTRPNHNLSLSEISSKAGVPVNKVKNVIIWGNHSHTMYPDTTYTTINGNKIANIITDLNYLQEEFIKKI